MQIDRARTNRATSRQRDLCFAEPRDKRAEHQNGRAHPAHQIVGCDRVIDPAGIECHRHAAGGVIDLGHHNTVLFEQSRHGRDIGKPRQVGERQRLGAEQAGGHQRQRRIFRAANADFTGKPVAALYDYLIHADMPSRPRLFRDGVPLSLSMKCLVVMPVIVENIYRRYPAFTSRFPIGLRAGYIPIIHHPTSSRPLQASRACGTDPCGAGDLHVTLRPDAQDVRPHWPTVGVMASGLPSGVASWESLQMFWSYRLYIAKRLSTQLTFYPPMALCARPNGPP